MTTIIIDQMTPGFTFPLLTATVTDQCSNNANMFKCDLETRPCPHTGCTGKLRNTTIYERLTWDSNGESNPYITRYPESAYRVIQNRREEAAANDGYVIHNGKPEKLWVCGSIETNEVVSYDEFDWDEAKKHVNEPVFLLYDSRPADVIDCDVCNNWYVVCLDCKKPCIIKSFVGSFSEDIYNPHTKEYTDGSYIELCRKTVTLMDNSQSEFIGVSRGSEHVEFKSNPPYTIVKPIKEWDSCKPTKDESGSEESEEESYDEDDWRGWYQLEDKRAIWARDPRLNLYIGHCKYTPLLTGTDGGFPIYYQCESCNKTYDFSDK